MSKDKNKNEKNPFEMLPENWQKMIDEMVLSDQIIEGVMEKMNISEDDFDGRVRVFRSLWTHAEKQIEISVWQNLSDDQAVHLRDFIRQSHAVYPDKTITVMMVEFADMYPELQKVIVRDLEEFFSRYVKNFNAAAGQ